MRTPPDRYPRPSSRLGGSAAWRGRLGQPGWVLLPARLFLGGTFLFAGLSKLADPLFFDASRPTSIQGQLALFRTTSPIGALLGPVQSHAVAFGVLTALAEVAVGLGTLLGLFARIAAAGGFLLSTSFFLTVSFHTKPYYYGSDIFVMVMWLPFIAVGAPGVLSLDAWRLQPSGGPDPDRRRLLRAGLASGAVAALGAVLAGASAGLGRLFSDSSRRSAAPATPTPTPSRSGAPQPRGARIAAVADLPVGGVLAFRDPGSGQPALLVRPGSAEYRAFNAICPHAGCRVRWAAQDSRFACPCHGSLFDDRTGRVLAGPAPRGLTPIPVRVVGSSVEASPG